MKRDIDLVRQLLLCIDGQGASGALRSTMFEGHSEEKVRYHLRLLADSGLVKYVEKNVLGTTILRLTWEGHELLELARDEQVWDRAKRLVYEKTGGLAVEAIRQVLVKWAIERSCEDDRWVSVGHLRSLVESANANGNGNDESHSSAAPRFVATNWGPARGETPLRWSQPEIPVGAYENFSYDTEDPRFGRDSAWYGAYNGTLPIYLL